MFRANQIYSPTSLMKNFSTVMRELTRSPAAVLIRRKRGEPFVLVNARIFEELMDFHCQIEEKRIEHEAAARENQELIDAICDTSIE
jgi:hypothetical protein